MSDALAGLARSLALALTERPSVTGTPDEASFGPWLLGYLSAQPHWEGSEAWSFPVAEGDGRHVVCLLLRRGGPRTVILTGHYDTVTTEDYGDLRPLATSPETLLPALAARVAGATEGAEALAREDLASGTFIPGRGLLDMKGGLAAGLAAMAAFAEEPGATGSLLFVAVPDEESSSAGARAAAAALGSIAEARGLDIAAAVNLDSAADDDDGAEGRVVTFGTVGKVLPVLHVAGVASHSGYPLRGLNAAALAAAVAARLEWAPELRGDDGTPATLLSLRDGKTGYDVTVPASAQATLSILFGRADPAGVLPAVARLAEEAARDALRAWRARADLPPEAPALQDIPVHLWGDLLTPEARPEMDALAARLKAGGMDLPTAAPLLLEALWRREGRGPGIVLGLGSTPYLAATLRSGPLRAACEAVAAQTAPRLGTSLTVVERFAGISDVSFWGQADASAFGRLARHTPGWDSFVGLHEGSLAQVPTVNLGPWGRDYHTPLERIEADYAFRLLPRLLLDLCRRVLA